MSYVPSVFSPKRRKTRVVHAGSVPIGGENPIVVQSMTTTPTSDTMATVDQIQKLQEAGCQIVRITTPTINDAKNLENIRREMEKRKLHTPLVADVHFLPQVAMEACNWVEKVRVNPGNFADRKRFEVKEYTDQEYEAEIQRLYDAFAPIVQKAQKKNIAVRIGTNHGSLSDRIMNRYGDTPMGMVESALEFVRIAEAENFRDIVISMKSSNPVVMIQAYRLLVSKMNELNMDYPLHLGVTEAGNGQDGRVKSAIGISSLLSDGLGDTVRVSLTEDPEFEIPVARKIIEHFGLTTFDSMREKSKIDSEIPWNIYQYERQKTEALDLFGFQVGGDQPPKVFSHIHQKEMSQFAQSTDRFDPEVECLSFDLESAIKELPLSGPKNSLVRVQKLVDSSNESIINPSFGQLSIHPNETWIQDRFLSKLKAMTDGKILWLRCERESDLKHAIAMYQALEGSKVGVEIIGRRIVHLARKAVHFFHEAKIRPPILLHWKAGHEDTEEDIVVQAPSEIGALLCDGIGDCIEINTPHAKLNHDLAFTILQSTRLRMSRADYIACPSCGRTLFDLQTTTERIKSKTDHLKGVKIAIMGCIVNGPGEMADADFGYVGSGPGHINLYVGKECVKRSIPENEADQRLIDLIKEHGRWSEPSAT